VRSQGCDRWTRDIVATGITVGRMKGSDDGENTHETLILKRIVCNQFQSLESKTPSEYKVCPRSSS
jgi:hypothetical protein